MTSTTSASTILFSSFRVPQGGMTDYGVHVKSAPKSGAGQCDPRAQKPPPRMSGYRGGSGLGALEDDQYNERQHHLIFIIPGAARRHDRLWSPCEICSEKRRGAMRSPRTKTPSPDERVSGWQRVGGARR